MKHNFNVVIFDLSSANTLTLDRSKVLLFGNGLRDVKNFFRDNFTLIQVDNHLTILCCARKNTPSYAFIKIVNLPDYLIYTILYY